MGAFPLAWDNMKCLVQLDVGIVNHICAGDIGGICRQFPDYSNVQPSTPPMLF
jgi:hypothetical protein